MNLSSLGFDDHLAHHTDQAAAEARPTYDVNAIVEITSYAAYADFSERLQKLGFTEDTTEGAPSRAALLLLQHTGC